MQRRSFIGSTAVGTAGLAASGAAAQGAKNQYFHIHEFSLRNSKSQQRRRLVDFLEKAHLPAMKREGIDVGYFQVSLGPQTPRLFTLEAFDSLAAFEEKRNAVHADKEFMGAAGEFESAEPAYDRVQSWLLKAFDGMPRIEIPKPKGKPRHFDLRVYEGETFADVSEKMNMFNSEEIPIFRKTGVNPLLFGQTIIGSGQPNLTYIAYYDDMAARDKAWKKFVADEDWNRIKVKPGWGNDDIVMTVSNTFLRPLPFSPIR